jgi:hypothetical protein
MTAFFIKYFVFCFISATLLSVFEIQTEGKHGWAEKLPTWKISFKFLDSMPGFRGPVTGYHIYLFTMVLFLVHIPFLFMRWDIRTEVIILSAYTLIVALEDFLWFVFNPYYGLKKFNKKHIPWHEDWFGPIPLQYVYVIVLWITLFVLGFWII